MISAGPPSSPEYTESFEYDELGRVKSVDKLIRGQVFSIRYQYNHLDAVEALEYPSTRVVEYTSELTGSTVTVESGNTIYIGDVVYGGGVHPREVQFGSGVTASFGYDATDSLLDRIEYQLGGNTVLGFDLGYEHSNGSVNGQLTRISDDVAAGRSTSFAYDALGRLESAVTDGDSGFPKWGLQWDYDRFGNRLEQVPVHGSPPGNSISVGPGTTTNRIDHVGYEYDAAGNLTSDGWSYYEYDAAGRMISMSKGGVVEYYGYDPAGGRIWEEQSGEARVLIRNGLVVLAEYVGAGAPRVLQKEHVYLGFERLASHDYTQPDVSEPDKLRYSYADHLSRRLSSNGIGGDLREQGHYPFGETWYPANAESPVFTTYERDEDSNLDYSYQRYYDSSLGRFSTPDNVAGSAESPQSWNRYAYVTNDPVNGSDPSGDLPIIIIPCSACHGFTERMEVRGEREPVESRDRGLSIPLVDELGELLTWAGLGEEGADGQTQCYVRYTEARWTDGPTILDVEREDLGIIWPGAYTRIRPTRLSFRLGLYGRWHRFHGTFAGSIECRGMNTCGVPVANSFSLRFPVASPRFGVGKGVSFSVPLPPILSTVRQGIAVAEGLDTLSEVFDLQKAGFVAASLEFARRPVVVCYGAHVARHLSE